MSFGNWDKGLDMDVGGKILTGAAATALLALVGHYATADSFIAELENRTQTEMTAQGMSDVTVTFSRDPIARNAVLDGDVDDATKQKALATALAIPGVSGAGWKGETVVAGGASGDASDPADPVMKEKIADCQAKVDAIMKAEKISFRSGSAYVSPASNKILDKLASALKPCAGLTIAVSGHTDNKGNAGVNKTMSQERADRIRQGLIDRDIPANLVTATGYGAEKPLNQGGGATADAENRRIEFKLQAGKNDAVGQQGE